METDLSLNLNLRDTELTLGLPGTQVDSSKDKDSPPPTTATTTTARLQKRPATSTPAGSDSPTLPKAQVVGWPPIRSYRKNNLQLPHQQHSKKKEESSTISTTAVAVETNTTTNNDTESSSSQQNFIKVSMDGAPYLRKIDLNGYRGGYPDLLKGLETMFKFTVGHYSEREGYKGSEFVPTYEDKDGDLMLVGDVPWEMFMSTCKRLRIMKGSEAKGLGGGCCV